jgi:hypothetical protein
MSMKLKLTPLAILGAIGAFAAGSAGAGGLTLNGVYQGDVSNVTVDASGNVTATVGSPPPPGSPPSCSVSAPSTATVNTSVSISASCSPAATSCAWTDDGPTPNGCGGNVTFTTTGTFHYQVQGTNSNGTGSLSAEKTITVSAAPPPPPPGDYTLDSTYDAKFDAPGAVYYPTVYGGNPTAFQFDNDIGINTGKFYIVSANQQTVDIAISATPGDFTNVTSNACKALSMGSSKEMRYKTTSASGYCHVPANTTMYLNVRSTSNSNNAALQVVNYVIN